MKKKKNKLKIIFIIISILFGIYISYYFINKSNIEIKDKEIVDFISNTTFNDSSNYILKKLVYTISEKSNPLILMKENYKEYKKEEEVINNETSPIIYIYNSHQQEEYATTNYIDFSINPTVIMNDYILEDIFNKNGYKTIVEESSISDILKNNNWNYVNSYKASRTLLEDIKSKYPTLNYFIDIHRDSLKKDKTTITIDDKSYAKILFIIGLENTNYEKNLEFTEKLHNKINEMYPNLSKGIYKKGGEGVNGIYNQDFHENTILVEIGGYENNSNEVLNTSIAFSKAFMEVINE